MYNTISAEFNADLHRNIVTGDHEAFHDNIEDALGHLEGLEDYRALKEVLKDEKDHALNHEFDEEIDAFLDEIDHEIHDLERL